MKRTSHKYLVVMCDHGKRGLEAIVQPENTRRMTVEMIANGDYSNIVFIHEVDDFYIEDVTLDLLNEAESQLREAAAFHRSLRVAANIDHVRDLRKHGAV
jgi:hypothetical protein